jgi:hypothetical protein
VSHEENTVTESDHPTPESPKVPFSDTGPEGTTPESRSLEDTLEMHGLLPSGTVNVVNPDGTTIFVYVASLKVGQTVVLDSPGSDMVASTGLPSIPSAPVWLDAASSPFGIPVLDVRSITWTSTSMTGNAAIVERFRATRSASGPEYDGQHPEPTVAVPCNLMYPAPGALTNGRAFVASVMEDKWDVFLTRDVIRVLRSWTGEVIFVASVTPFGHGGPLIKVDRLEYSAEAEMGPAEAVMDFDFVMKAYVYRDVVPYRCPDALADKSPQELAVAAFSRHGRRAAYLTFVDPPLGYGGSAPKAAAANPDPPKQIADERLAREEITAARDGGGGRSAGESWYEPLAWVLAVLDGEGETDWALGDYGPVTQDPVRTIEARLLREIVREITADEFGAWEAEATGGRWANALAWTLSVLTSGDSKAIRNAANRTAADGLGPAPRWAPNRW